MSSKRIISILLPVRIEGDHISVFMQKRSADMERLPNYFGFWGGGCEGDETPEQGLIREIQEELGKTLDVTQFEPFNRYEFLRSIKHTYLFRPDPAWETTIIIGEGDYGMWMTVEDALQRKDIILEDKVVLQDLERVLLQKSIR